MRFVRPKHFGRGFLGIFRIGIGASALDLGTIVIGAVMNNQILKYGGTTELAIYGVIATIMALFQALFGGVGQAIQPLVSSNFGAGKADRIKKIWKYSLSTVLAVGFVFMALGELFPIQITKLFVDADEVVLAAVPGAFRMHFIVYLFLGITVLSAYYLQSVMKELPSILVGFAHSVVLSSAMCLFLPLLMGMTGVWMALPVTEIIISGCAVLYISHINRNME